MAEISPLCYFINSLLLIKIEFTILFSRTFIWVQTISFHHAISGLGVSHLGTLVPTPISGMVVERSAIRGFAADYPFLNKIVDG